MLLELLENFPPEEVQRLKSFLNVCCNIEDDEAVRTTAPFFGNHWDEIEPETWESNPTAMLFFTTEAMNYYLPSLIECSIKSFKSTILAVDGILRELSRQDDIIVNKWRYSRWINLKLNQINIVKKWIRNKELSSVGDWESLRGNAVKTLDSFSMLRIAAIEQGLLLE